MKTPISYYGGKQKLASLIIRLIPDHSLYCEPFIGGGAVFFQKPKSKVEVINDTNKELINFYEMVQDDFVSLEKEIRIALHSRDIHRKATVIYGNPDMFSKIKRAAAVWILSSQSFSSKLNGTWGYGIQSNTTSKKIKNKRESFTEEYAIRLQDVQLECTDALRIIRSRDRVNSFFYLDPPYFNSDCGHYDGYSKEDFEQLLDLLSKIEGKFILSSYPSEILKDYTEKYNWDQHQIEQIVSVARKKTKQKKKIEVLTANFELPKKELIK